MDNIAIFDAKSWMMGSCPGAVALRPETLDVVSNFTLIWNLFEDALCNNKAKVDAFDNIAKAIAPRALPDDVKAGIEFWANRYRTDKSSMTFCGFEFPSGRQERTRYGGSVRTPKRST